MVGWIVAAALGGVLVGALGSFYPIARLIEWTNQMAVEQAQRNSERFWAEWQWLRDERAKRGTER